MVTKTDTCGKGHLFLITLIIILMVGTGFSYAETFQYTLSAGDYEFVEAGEDYQQIEMTDFGQLLMPGKPKLPSRVFHIAIPPGVKVNNVTVTRLGATKLPGIYNIAPAPMVIPLSANKNEIEKISAAYTIALKNAYSSDSPYPAETASFIGQGGYRKYNLAQVRYSPFSYNARNGKLTFYPAVDVTVHYSSSKDIAERAEKMAHDYVAQAEKRAADLIVNYEETQQNYPKIEDTLDTDTGYVIITTEALLDAVQPLVNWETCKGMTVHVETVENIEGSYGGVDLAQDIRNWLLTNLSSWNILNVCLIGHRDDVPMRYAGGCRTDYYYAELTWPDSISWDSNGNGIYGKYGEDNVQFPSEVDVGRIPWGEPEIVENICQKMVDFEYSDDINYKLNYLFAQAFYWGDTDTAVVSDYIISNALDPLNPPIRIYEQGPCWDSTYYSEYGLSRTITQEVWSNQYGDGPFGFVNLSGHGSPYCVYYKESHSTCDSEAFFCYNNCGYLDDSHPSVVFAAACSTAYPANSNLPRKLLEQGAVAFVGATDLAYGAYGWNEPSDGNVSTLNYLFCLYATNYNYGRRTVGRSHQLALKKMYDDYGWGGSTLDWYQMFEWNLFSNPNLRIEVRPVNLPDLTSTIPVGWYNSIVPRSSGDATSGSCNITPTLPGNTDNTYYNWAYMNNGLNDSPSQATRIYLDNTLLYLHPKTSVPAGSDIKRINIISSKIVSGGRHTISLVTDEDEDVWETNEDDNCFSRQYVWSPYTLTDDTSVLRTAPPVRDAWKCTPLFVAYDNNDGFSFGVLGSGNNKWWSAVGILAVDSTADYNLKLWDIGDYTGSTAGFGGGYIQQSQQGGPVCDFVLVNDNKAAAGTYYAGVINYNAAGTDYRIEETTSTPIVPGTNGIYTIDTSSILDIYECYLSAGEYGFMLQQTAGTCDLGISLYDDDVATCNKVGYMPGAYANNSGGGGDESFTVTIPDDGYHALAVWKTSAGNLAKSASYNIKFGQCATPGTPADPTPENNATDVSVSTDLDWSDCDNTDHYEVYMKAGSAEWILLGTTEGSFWPLDPLDYDKTYAWQIRAVSIGGGYIAWGPQWIFTTTDQPEPTIIVTAPNGGELLYVGKTKIISWTSQYLTDNVKIEIYRGGFTWSTIVSSTTNDGSYSWSITGPASKLCSVRVSSVIDPGVSDVSNSYFTIADPYVTVLYPNGGEEWLTDDTYDITWESAGAEKNVNIVISRDNGSSWDPIVEGTYNDGLYQWTAVGPTSKACLIGVTDLSLGDTSDGPFLLGERSLTVTYPNGLETWYIQEYRKITWQSNELPGEVKIEISRNDGANWSTITESTENDSSYYWTVLSPCSVDCLVRITSLSYPGVSDTSNKNFIIDCPLVADLSGDCAVDEYDMSIFAEQWLASGNPADCPLSADFAGDDCKVNLQDFAVLASEWLVYFD